MKRIIIAFVVCLMPAMLFAVPGAGPWGGPWAGPADPMAFFPREAGPYVSAEILKVQTELGQQKIGELNVADIVSLRERLDVASQKDAFVKRISTESYFLPGLGQFETGETGNGLAFLGVDLAVLAGTLVGVYYALPSDLRFDRVDYFRDSFSTISSAWNGHSFTEYLPAIGVAFGGMIVDQLIRHWSSTAAAGDATRLIDRDGVKFTPRIGVGFMGFNVAY